MTDVITDDVTSGSEGKSFERVTVVDYKNSSNGRAVRFQGRLIAGFGDDEDEGNDGPPSFMGAYATPKGGLVIVENGSHGEETLLATYHSYAEFAAEKVRSYPFVLVDQIADALGEEMPAEELDI
jgi:hypothetical protein